MTSAKFKDHAIYYRLKQSRANIVVLLVRGNDLDSLTVKHEPVINLHRDMINELTAQNKIVYTCENPTRFSLRTEGERSRGR